MSRQGEESKAGFEDVVAALNAEKVQFLIIGAVAVAYHGHVRNSQDLDIYVRPTQANAERAIRALERLGFKDAEITPEVFTKDNGLSLGAEPMKVDLVANLPGVDEEKLWRDRAPGKFGKEDVCFISREDLIANKRAVGRPQDIADVQMLEAAKAREQSRSSEKDKGYGNEL